MDHLDTDSQTTLSRRKVIGEQILGTAWGRYPERGDEESAAKDAISHVLTRVIGIAGAHTVDADGQARVATNEYEINEARALVERAFSSWQYDREDYVVANPADRTQVEESPDRAALDK